MKNNLWILFFLLGIFHVSTTSVFAESAYVLPYPSFMPGSKFFAISQIWDEIKKYWYFGDFGQFSYNLKQSDKYLVEAKTLFEYRQYLLGTNALGKSDNYFNNIPKTLSNAKVKKKNITQKQNILKNAVLEHVEVLKKIKQEIPPTFQWVPEKKSPTTLFLHKLLDKSIQMRRQIL